MKPTKLNIYIGYDPREDAAYTVARRSMARRATVPTAITPLELKHLPMLTRPIEQKDGRMWCPISQAPMATEFAISRFCIPFLRKKGWALFVDCDIVCLSDILELFALADESYAVMCVKHEQAVKEGETKMDSQIQTFYARKNWSSVVLWNCSHPSNKKLTLDNLNQWPGRDLHAFKWLEDSEIGELPKKWNWLVNVTPGRPRKEGIWHYTLGGPFIKDWKSAPHDDVWLEGATA